MVEKPRQSEMVWPKKRYRTPMRYSTPIVWQLPRLLLSILGGKFAENTAYLGVPGFNLSIAATGNQARAGSVGGRIGVHRVHWALVSLRLTRNLAPFEPVNDQCSGRWGCISLTTPCNRLWGIRLVKEPFVVTTRYLRLSSWSPRMHDIRYSGGAEIAR